MNENADSDSESVPLDGPERLARARRLVEDGMEQGLHRGAQIYVSRQVDASTFQSIDLVLGQRAEGLAMETGTLNLWLSSTKPLTAAAFALLWQRQAIFLATTILTGFFFDSLNAVLTSGS